jgi:hypothetical protein
MKICKISAKSETFFEMIYYKIVFQSTKPEIMSSPALLNRRGSTSKWRTRLLKTFPIIGMVSSGYTASDILSDALAGQTHFKSIFRMKIEIQCA